jgi:hypothetical protein
MWLSKILASSIPALVLSVMACTSITGSGDLKVTTYGQDYVEGGGIPAAAGEQVGFVDGYTLHYSKFLLAFSALKIGDGEGESAAQMGQQTIFDLHPSGPQLMTEFDELPAQRWRSVEITVEPAQAAIAGNASTADVALMNQQGHAVYVEGEAVKGSAKKSFRWGFDAKARYYNCEEQTYGQGALVPAGGEGLVQFTVHGDHLFYDDLQRKDPSLRFEAMASADSDGDGEITLAELSKIDLTTLPTGQYGTGGDGSVKNLAQFVGALARTLIHYQGEGHCQSGK